MVSSIVLLFDIVGQDRVFILLFNIMGHVRVFILSCYRSFQHSPCSGLPPCGGVQTVVMSSIDDPEGVGAVY